MVCSFRWKLQISEAIGVDKTPGRIAAARNGFRPSGQAGKIFGRDLPQAIEEAQIREGKGSKGPMKTTFPNPQLDRNGKDLDAQGWESRPPESQVNRL